MAGLDCSVDQQGANTNNERYERQRRQRYQGVLNAIRMIEPEHGGSLRSGPLVRINLCMAVVAS